MSFETMAWAVKQRTANSGQKLVLLLLSNHSNGHTGQCNPSHRLLAEECSMGVSTLKGHIAALAEAGFITIINKFQDGVQLPNQYNMNVVGVSPILAGGQSGSGWGVGQNLATKQEVKPVKETNTVISNTERFDAFWNAYPRKINKGGTRSVFAKIKPSEETLQKMLSAIDKQKRSDQWKEVKYIPHPSSWLNGERWEDEDSTGKPSFNPLAGAI